MVHKDTRSALGISLRDNVVVLDECHNLPSAIVSSHEATLHVEQVDAAHAQLDAYLHKYAKRLLVNKLRSLCANAQSLIVDK